jgi:hypothetical protein
VADGEVFHADTGRDLIVQDAVGHRRSNAQDDNRDSVHHDLLGYISANALCDGPGPL